MTVRDSLKVVGPYAAAVTLAVICFYAGSWRNVNDPTVPVPAIALPDSIDVPVGGGAVKLDAKTRSKTAHVRWLTYPGDKDHIQVLQYPDHAQVISLVPGNYWVGADLASADGDAVWCLVNAGAGPRPPPVPPIVPPDNPPVPPVVPPSILTPYEQKLKDAYDQETDPNKTAYKSQLAALYRQGVPYTQDPTVTTSGNLYSRLVSAENVLDKGGTLPKTALPLVKRVIADDLKTVQTNPLVQITPAERSSFSQKFDATAKGLDKIGGLR